MLRSRITVMVCLFAAVQSGDAIGDVLTGDVAAADVSLMSINENPGVSAFLDRSQIGISPELFKTETMHARYPGFESASHSESGLGSILSAPSFIYKPNARLSLGGYALPPLGIEMDIKKRNLPVMVLGTLSYVDILAQGRLNGMAQFLIGYRVSPSLGLGVAASYQSVGFTAELVPSEGGEALADITGDITTVSSTFGVRYEVTPAIAVGLSFGLFSQNTQKISVESPLLADSDAAPGAQGSGGGSVSNPADSFLVGVSAALTDSLRLMTDVKYTRANPNSETYSLVDMKNKRRDVYDTLAVRAGAVVGVAPQFNGLLGFRYEPASVGPGSQGDDGTTGFGTIDLVSVFAGFDTLKPYTQYSVGLRIEHGWVAQRAERSTSRRKSKQAKSPQGFYAWETSFGLVYRLASLGVDENGELPGAYLQKKIFVPVTVVRKL